MKKVLFAATVMIHIQSFHISYLKWFKDRGFEVHVAVSYTHLNRQRRLAEN